MSTGNGSAGISPIKAAKAAQAKLAAAALLASAASRSSRANPKVASSVPVEMAAIVATTTQRPPLEPSQSISPPVMRSQRHPH